MSIGLDLVAKLFVHFFLFVRLFLFGLFYLVMTVLNELVMIFLVFAGWMVISVATLVSGKL